MYLDLHFFFSPQHLFRLLEERTFCFKETKHSISSGLACWSIWNLRLHRWKRTQNWGLNVMHFKNDFFCAIYISRGQKPKNNTFINRIYIKQCVSIMQASWEVADIQDKTRLCNMKQTFLLFLFFLKILSSLLSEVLLVSISLTNRLGPLLSLFPVRILCSESKPLYCQ